jgi:hypothetical protein
VKKKAKTNKPQREGLRKVFDAEIELFANQVGLSWMEGIRIEVFTVPLISCTDHYKPLLVVPEPI